MVVAFIVVAVIMIWVVPAFRTCSRALAPIYPHPHSWSLRCRSSSSSSGGPSWRHRRRYLFLLPDLAALRHHAKRMDRILLKIPVFGDLLFKSAVALDAHPVHHVRGWRALGRIVGLGGRRPGNAVFAEATEAIQRDVSTGSALTTAMTTTGIFPTMVLQMASIGERIGLAGPHARQGGRVLRGRSR